LIALYGEEFAAALSAFAERLPSLIEALRRATPNEAQALIHDATAALRGLLDGGEDFKIDLLSVAQGAVNQEDGATTAFAGLRAATIAYDADRGRFTTAIEIVQADLAGDDGEDAARLRAERFAYASVDGEVVVAPAAGAEAAGPSDAVGDADGLYPTTFAEQFGGGAGYAPAR